MGLVWCVCLYVMGCGMGDYIVSGGLCVVYYGRVCVCVCVCVRAYIQLARPLRSCVLLSVVA